MPYKPPYTLNNANNNMIFKINKFRIKFQSEHFWIRLEPLQSVNKDNLYMTGYLSDQQDYP